MLHRWGRRGAHRYLGSVAARADLLVVGGNPLKDPAMLRDILMVVSDGRIVLDRLPSH